MAVTTPQKPVVVDLLVTAAVAIGADGEALAFEHLALDRTSAP
jgi:hypothetical protein